MKSNFELLGRYWPALAEIGKMAENDDTQAGRIRGLKRERLRPLNMDDILYVMQKRRNDAVHAYGNESRVLLKI